MLRFIREWYAWRQRPFETTAHWIDRHLNSYLASRYDFNPDIPYTREELALHVRVIARDAYYAGWWHERS